VFLSVTLTENTTRYKLGVGGPSPQTNSEEGWSFYLFNFDLLYPSVPSQETYGMKEVAAIMSTTDEFLLILGSFSSQLDESRFLRNNFKPTPSRFLLPSRHPYHRPVDEKAISGTLIYLT